ncbi:hypothetical protein EHS25_000642 [Saitozyma podzolica]|uniref:SGNH hydrolase-type esterase domain-containing protein n=1 Tax=Saitozyma podzolica TaxID=1890683 RepID=A0A427YWN6_9TREE|nr:hypothetical protein EHS25_000642 [Saitozyma podzolica]
MVNSPGASPGIALGSQANGYVATLAEMYCGKMDVVNRGFGGYNTRQLLKKLRDDFYNGVPEGEVRLITINIGTNDSANTELAHVPLDKYKQNLRDIIAFFRSAHPDAKLILLTPSTCDIEMWDHFMSLLQVRRGPGAAPERDPSTLRVYADACLEIVGEYDNTVVGVDLWSPIDQALSEGLLPEEIFTDGVHFRREGYEIISEAVTSCIRTNIPALEPFPMPDAFTWNVTYDNEGSPACAAILKKVKEKTLDIPALLEAQRQQNLARINAVRGG